MLFSKCRGARIRSVLGACLFASAAGLAFVPLCAPTGAAQSEAAKALVDMAKARGAVGEQGDGFLGFVTPPTDAALSAAVAEINAGRLGVYRQTAMRTGVTPEAAGQATAQQLFMRLPAGQFFKPLDGAWVRK